MPRGMTPGTYTSDGGTDYRYNTDRDRFADGTFGWTAASIALNRLPRGCTPRHVTGVSATSGYRGTAVVPVVTADVWTGAATTFDIEATDGTTDTMTITGRIGERPVLS
jgi:hypothetical protein